MHLIQPFCAVLASLPRWSSWAADWPVARTEQVARGLSSGSSVGPVGIPNNNGIYDSSVTPAALPWNTYNFCNAPHVAAAHYAAPARNASLAYLIAVMRHHKRTPDNLYPNENALNPVPWDCTGLEQYDYATSPTPDSAPVFHTTASPPWHPFRALIWNGTCDQGQLTPGGLADAVRHGRDFFSVYGPLLRFLTRVHPEDILVRASTEPRTHQTAGALLAGMNPASARRPFPVLTQPAAVGASRPPDDAASRARTDRQHPPELPLPRRRRPPHRVPGRARVDGPPRGARRAQGPPRRYPRHRRARGLGVLMITSSTPSPRAPAMASRCRATSLANACPPRTPAPSSKSATGSTSTPPVLASPGAPSRTRARSYIWNTAANSTLYSQLQFGAFMMELAHDLRAFRARATQHKLKLFVGHDGTLIRLAALLGLGHLAPLRWPALGSELVFEVWREAGQGGAGGEGGYFVRVMHDGTPVASADPALDLRWVPFDDFLGRVEAQVLDDLWERCAEA